ncbi:MAG: DUF177 domain-containing protein [Lachnospira sp.]|nr:DUF177 domain-containing protein [Lachnospira sp.]
MLIDLRELLSGTKDSISVDVMLDMTAVDTGASVYDVVEKNPFELKVNKLGKNKLQVKADGEIVLDIPCDRCLNSVLTKLEFNIDQDMDFDDKSTEDEEQEEKDYIDGYNLDVDRLVFGEIMLSMPGKTLCKDDCKGLCLVCGADLNVAECGCDREVLDPRMSVFKDILKNFKEV